MAKFRSIGMRNLLKLNIGTYFAFAYMLGLFAIWLEINIYPDMSQAGIAIVFLTIPWSILSLGAAEKLLSGPDVLYLFPYLIVLSMLINMLLLHLCGAGLSAISRKFNR